MSLNTRLNALPSIPSHPAPHWEQLRGTPIKDNGERLVPMSLAPAPISVFPAYARMSIPGAVQECFVREGVYRALLAAARSLPDGIGIIVFGRMASVAGATVFVRHPARSNPAPPA